MEILFCYNCINGNDNVIIFKAKCEDLVEEAIPAFRFIPKLRDSFLNLFLLAKKRPEVSGPPVAVFSSVKNRFKKVPLIGVGATYGNSFSTNRKRS